MSLLATPLLLTNLACEMLFVISQRLDSQNISENKSRRVLNDLARAFFHPSQVRDLFVPQPLCSQTEARTRFRELAHSSVMKLNDASMSKLFDLMFMVCKYHALQCQEPSRLIQVTLKHIEEVENLFDNDDVPNADALKEALHATYANLTAWEWHELMRSIFLFFQDKNVKVSPLLQAGVQLRNGRILLPTISEEAKDRIGCLTTYNSRGEQTVARKIDIPCLSRGGKGDADTTIFDLGTNLYAQKSGKSKSLEPKSFSPVEPFDSIAKTRDRNRVSTLSSLLGVRAGAEDGAMFDLEMDGDEIANAAPELSIIDGEGATYRQNLAKSAEAFDNVADGDDSSHQDFQDALLSLLRDM